MVRRKTSHFKLDGLRFIFYMLSYIIRSPFLLFKNMICQASTIHFGWICAHDSLRLLLLTDRSGTQCGLLLL